MLLTISSFYNIFLEYYFVFNNFISLYHLFLWVLYKEHQIVHYTTLHHIHSV